MTCIYALTKINYTYEIPMFMISLRGGGDSAKYQVSNGLYLVRCRLINLPYAIVESRNELSTIRAAYRHTR